MSRSDDLRAELALAELEDELTAAKKDKGGASRELKARVRAARAAYRTDVRKGA
jgi:hypothetical protein